ncbi:threonine--tRNA ligase [bacterium]|nr:MAG: threonine--tRNA ligase [bacterium]
MNNEQLSNKRHSLAHLLASAVLEQFPDAKLGIGPVIDNGFYYDFIFSKPLSPDDLPKIEKCMRELAKSNLAFERQDVSSEEAKSFYANKDQPFKDELINELSDTGESLSLYKTGEFTDLCRGGHVENTSEIDPESFKLDKLAGAYWRGDETKPMMTRIYGLAFETKEELDAYLNMREEALKRDHKKLGPELDLFVFSDLIGAGLPLWTPKGTLVRNMLDDYVWELRQAKGYTKVEIPHITKKDLYEKSGHWDKFKDELFRITTREGHEFAMKPMNCPHHTQIYNRKRWSYRELPQRYCNTTTCYRDEQSGELAGLSRVRAFAQDDAHVFTRLSEAKQEFVAVWDIIETFYKTFGFELKVRLSTRDPQNPDNYLGNSTDWDKAQDLLKEIAKEKGVETLDGIGEAAFYGPKLDFMANDSLGRQWQVATIQFDFNMPERFDLFCINEQGEQERIVMIHAAIMGSIERFLSVLIEHTGGNFPTWLSPLQAVVLPISEKQTEYAGNVIKQLKDSIPNLRVELDDRSESIGKRIREAAKQKVPYLLVVGDKEIEADSLAIRKRGDEDLGIIKVSDFIQTLKSEIEQKS